MAEQSQTKKKYTVGKTALMILLFSVSIVSLMCGLVISFGYVRRKLVFMRPPIRLLKIRRPTKVRRHGR